ncbi:MAG: MFS transporter [Chloroflexi bacterium]|nr:MFS transporter [Chloroflexota bacterium]
MPTNLSPAKASKRERFAWYMYDFGNSAYAAIVLLAVYSAYFKGTVVGGALGTRLWGVAVGIAMLVVAIISPVVGAIADFTGAKKKFLFAFTVQAVVFMGLLFFVQKGDVTIGMIFFILAEIGYRSAQVVYDAFLPEIASPQEMGKVSGMGWAVGSAGGIVSLLFTLPFIMLIKGTFPVRLAMVIGAAFYAVSSIFLFLWLPEKASAQKLPPGETVLTVGFHRLWQTMREAKKYKQAIRFVLASIAFNGGVIAALDYASILGGTLFGIQQQGLIILVILVQLTNIAGSWVFGEIVQRYDTKRSLILSIVLMTVAVLLIYITPSATMFYIVASVAGFAMAGVQSVSRTMVGKISPKDKSAEFFGFYSVAGRTSSFLGPSIYGWVAADLAHRFMVTQGLDAHAADQAGLRLGIFVMAAFLVIGLLLLLSMNEKKAIEAVSEEN